MDTAMHTPLTRHNSQKSLVHTHTPQTYTSEKAIDAYSQRQLCLCGNAALTFQMMSNDVLVILCPSGMMGGLSDQTDTFGFSLSSPLMVAAKMMQLRFNILPLGFRSRILIAKSNVD